MGSFAQGICTSTPASQDKEIKLLSQYVRKLEEEARIRDSQRERLLTDASISRSKFKQTDGRAGVNLGHGQ